MSKPILAIVGRPNVGKSTLFNALAGSRLSIVEDTPGVTRDRLYADVQWLDREFTIIDTGGIEPESQDILLSQMREQAQIAMETADVILFLTDVRQGLVDADLQVADLIRKSRKPVVLGVNKVDHFKRQEADVYEFYNLGLGDPFPISAEGKQGLGDLLDEILRQFPKDDTKEGTDSCPKIAIIGKPNVGKSSLINKLVGENRLLVSDLAGTTRDAVDTPVRRDGKEYILIDTAGLRRKSKIKEDLERYSIIRAVSAVERCDVAVVLIDAQEGITEQDAKITGIAHERGKGLLLVVNKWDLIEKDEKSTREFTDKIRSTLPFAFYADILFVSAKTGQRLPRLFSTVDTILENQTRRIATGVLNEVVWDALAMQQPPSDKGKRLKIYYMTQVAVSPPTFVIFLNDKKLMHFSYQRYLENRLRDAFSFSGTRLRFLLREKQDKEVL